MSLKHKLLGILIAITAGASFAVPNIQQLESKIQIKNIKSIKETPIPGLFEVLTEDNLVYSNETGDYIIVGELFNTTTQESLSKTALQDIIKTAEVQRIQYFKQNIEYFKNNSIIEKIGNGSKTLFIFTNPDCPYCRKLEPTLIKLNDTTIYRIIIPANPETMVKVNNIWCSKDKLETWKEAILNKKIEKTLECETPILKNLELADKLKISGTPTMLNMDGKVLRGVRNISEIEDLIK